MIRIFLLAPFETKTYIHGRIAKAGSRWTGFGSGTTQYV